MRRKSTNIALHSSRTKLTFYDLIAVISRVRRASPERTKKLFLNWALLHVYILYLICEKRDNKFASELLNFQRSSLARFFIFYISHHCCVTYSINCLEKSFIANDRFGHHRSSMHVLLLLYSSLLRMLNRFSFTIVSVFFTTQLMCDVRPPFLGPRTKLMLPQITAMI